MKRTRYRELHAKLKEGIQQGAYSVGDFLPSEHELCTAHSITRTTVRRALDELLREGYIEKQHGKGTRVRERNQSLGLLNVKGFSEAVGQNVRTVYLQKPAQRPWSDAVHFSPSRNELDLPCLHFERLRFVGNEPVMLENNWFGNVGLEDLISSEFSEGSFFRTLSRKHLIEITGSDQELRAEAADSRLAELLRIPRGAPVLHISIRFATSRQMLNIYSELYCNTTRYPIGNSYQP